MGSKINQLAEKRYMEQPRIEIEVRSIENVK